MFCPVLDQHIFSYRFFQSESLTEGLRHSPRVDNVRQRTAQSCVLQYNVIELRRSAECWRRRSSSEVYNLREE